MKNRKFLLSTNIKSSLLYLLLFTISFVVIGLLIYALTRHALEQQLRGNIETELLQLKSHYTAEGQSGLVREINERMQHGRRTAYLYSLLDDNGHHIAGNLNGFKPAVGWQIDIAPADPGQPDEEEKIIYIKMIKLDHGLRLATGYDGEYIEDAGEAIIHAFLWGGVLVLIFGSIGGYYLNRRFLHKINRITRSTRAIIAGDLKHRLAVSDANDELDNLAALLNQMLDKIETLIRNIQQISGDIAHDLRTPISRLKYSLEQALHSTVTTGPEQRRDHLRTAITEVDTILNTFSALLRITQIESGSRRSGFKIVSLDEIVGVVITAMEAVAEEQGKSLTSVLTPLQMKGDRELLTQLLYNLVENAIVHTPDGTPIHVELTETGGEIILQVADHGPGVPSAYRDKIFQRFYRLEPARNTPGNGLGLSIVTSIVELHDGRIDVRDNQPGLDVRVIFPQSN